MMPFLYIHRRILQESSTYSEDFKGLAKLAEPSVHSGSRRPHPGSSDVRLHRSRPTAGLLDGQRSDAAAGRRTATAFPVLARHNPSGGEAAGNAGRGTSAGIARRRADAQSTQTAGDV